MKTFECKYCGTLFTRRSNGDRVSMFCSKECLSKAKQKVRFCAECGDQIVYNAANKRTNKQFCSRECSTSYRRKGISEDHKNKIIKSKTGKPLSKEHRQSLSNAKMGKPIKHLIDNKEEVRAKISQALTGKPQPWNRGENHPNYVDGGKSQFQRQKEMGRVEYKNWRRAIFERDDYTCQMCGERGVKLQADHIKSWRDYPEQRYELNNGRTLCKSCHTKTETYGGRKKVA